MSQLLKFDEEFRPVVEKAMAQAAQELTAATHAHIVEQVQNRLHSTREKYLEHLFFEQVSRDTWVVELEPGALWIEDGLPAGREMIDDMLNDKPKPQSRRGHDDGRPKGRTRVAKDGSRYRIIPFDLNKKPSSQTPAEKSLTDVLKSEMKKRNIPYGKLEAGADGKPKTGLVRAFDILDKPLKTHEGPGQGKGPVGQVKQNENGAPVLRGVRVYQNRIKDRQGKETVKKFIMTFRIVSTKQKGSGKWVHPGLEAKLFFDEAFEWALKEWEEKIQPKVLEGIVSQL